MTIFKKIIRELKFFLIQLIIFFPGGLGNWLRKSYLKNQVQSSGSEISVGIGLVLTGGKNICIGSRVNIMRFNHIYAHNGI